MKKSILFISLFIVASGGFLTIASGDVIATTNLLSNPGAETGDIASWVNDTNISLDSGIASAIQPRTGNYDFLDRTGGGNGSLSQVVSLVGNQGITAAAIDGGGLLADVSFWEQAVAQGFYTGGGYISLDFWDGASNVISSVSTVEMSAHNGWANDVKLFKIPAGTRYIQYTMNFVWHGFSPLVYVDDNSLTILDSSLLPRLAILPAGTDALITWPTNHADGFILEQTTNLQNAVWSDVSPLPSIVSSNYSVTLPLDSANCFFRLYNP
jgi:hypothetical protein